MRRLGSLVVVALALSAPAAAHAQGTEDPAGAQFDIGLAAMKAEKYETACPAFAESYRLDPRAGVVFTLAECEAKWGKLASALSHYDAYLEAYAKMKPDEQSRQGRRAEIAQSQRRSLEQEVPRLTVRLPGDAAPGTTVVVDGVALGAGRVGTPVPLDPGDHVVVMNSPDGSSDEHKITLSVRERRALDLGAASRADAATGEPEPAAPAAPAEGEGGRSPVPMVAAIGVALVGVGVGTATGILAAGKRDTINEHCVGTKCDATGKQAGDDAKSLATMSTIGFGVGIAAGATAVVLLLTAPSSPKTTARRGWRPDFAALPGGAAIGASGAF